jgi:hypothetical protein
MFIIFLYFILETAMALNKFMHPRNIYRNRKANFQHLAIKYPEFRKHVFPDVSGKLFLDFKNPDSLRQLSITLMKHDFGLDVELPPDRLVPTIPLRLNYILWVEDILKGSNVEHEIKGIDIGELYVVSQTHSAILHLFVYYLCFQDFDFQRSIICFYMY